jgi:tetratricopeptide (TPR) repeat protein
MRDEHNRGICFLALAILLPPMAVSCSSRKTSDAARYRGWAHAEKGDYDKAIADFTEAIRLDPKLAIAFADRAISYAIKGEHDKAIADFTQAIRLDPKDALAYSNRARVYRALGDESKAASDEKKAQDLRQRE